MVQLLNKQAKIVKKRNKDLGLVRPPLRISRTLDTTAKQDWTRHKKPGGRRYSDEETSEQAIGLRQIIDEASPYPELQAPKRLKRYRCPSKRETFVTTQNSRWFRTMSDLLMWSLPFIQELSCCGPAVSPHPIPPDSWPLCRSSLQKSTWHCTTVMTGRTDFIQGQVFRNVLFFIVIILFLFLDTSRCR